MDQGHKVSEGQGRGSLLNRIAMVKNVIKAAIKAAIEDVIKDDNDELKTSKITFLV